MLVCFQLFALVNVRANFASWVVSTSLVSTSVWEFHAYFSVCEDIAL